MQNKQTQFKAPSKKHQPKGLTILYEDQDIIVVDKIHGLLTIGTDRERYSTAYYLLTEYVKKGNERSRNRVFIVHRLDRDTSGVLVFAKNEEAKLTMQEQWQDFQKKYYAVVYGLPEPNEGVISSYLMENKAFQVYSVKDAGKGKFSKTGYKVTRSNGRYSLLEIELFTGRKNQIRVHLSEQGHPVVGDKVYGRTEKGIKRLALHSASIKIIHPYTQKEMFFETEVPTYFKLLVKSREVKENKAEE